MRKRLLFIFIFFILLGTVGYFYINNVFLPVKFKNFIVNHAQQFLQKDVSIGRITYQPIKGLVIEDINIYEDTEHKRTLTEIKELHFNVLLAPLFKSKHLIIPAVHVIKPVIHMTRNEDSTWNFQEIFDKPRIRQQQNKYTLILRKLKIEKGEIEFIDRSLDKDFYETLNGFNLEVIISLDKVVKYDLRAHLENPNAKFNIKGQLPIDTKEIKSKITYSNIPITRYLNTYAPNILLSQGILAYGDIELSWLNKDLEITGNTTAEDIHLKIGAQADIYGTYNITNTYFQWANNRLIAKGNINGLYNRIELSGNKSLTTDLDLNIEQLNYDSTGINLAGNIKAFNSNFKINNTQSVKGDFSGTFKDLSYFEGALKTTASLAFKDFALNITPSQNLKADITSEKFKAEFKNDELKIQSDLVLNNPAVNWDKLIIHSNKFIITEGILNQSAEQVSISVKTQTGNIKSQWDNAYTFTGSPSITADIVIPSKPDSLLSYKATVTSQNAKIENLPYISSLYGLSGTVNIEPDLISTDSLGFIWNDMNFAARGNLKKFSDPAISLTFESNSIDFKKASPLFTDYAQLYQIFPEGIATLKMDFKGSLSDLENSSVIASSNLKNVKMELKNINQTITDLTGKIFFDYAKEQVKWKDLRFYIDKNAVNLSGELNDFSRPVVTTSLNTGKIKLVTETNILRRAVQFTFLQGTYANSAFDIKGDAHFPENGKSKADLRGAFELDLTDLTSIVPSQRERIEKYHLKGIINGKGLFKGQFDDWRNWQLTFDAGSPSISLFGVTLNNATVKYGQRDQTVSDLDIAGIIYNGNLSIDSKIDLRTDDLPLNLTLSLTNFDLSAYRRDKLNQASQLAGMLTARLEASGPLMDTQKILGEGTMNITDGYLYHKSTKDGIVGLLFIVPEIQDLIFTNAKINYSIKNHKVNILESLLMSKQVNLRFNGWIDREKFYDLTLKPEISDLVMARSESARKLPTTLLSQLITYHCTGQVGITKQNCTRKSNPLNILESTVGGAGQLFKEGVGELIGDIFGK